MAQTNPNSLANLKPPWTSENAATGGRRPNAIYPSEALRMLADKTVDELHEYANGQRDKRANVIAAARQMLASVQEEPGRVDERGKGFDRVADRLEGKPQQMVKVDAQQQVVTPANVLAQIKAQLQLPQGGETQALDSEGAQ